MARADIFVSYSHADSNWLKRLKPYLKPLESSGTMTFWDDTQIKPGAKWRDEIKQALQRAKVAVLLVSQSFLASDFITDEELRTALEAEERGGLTIFWIAVSSSTYKNSPIEQFQAANNPDRPLDSLKPAERNAELVKIAGKIQETLARVNPYIARWC